MSEDRLQKILARAGVVSSRRKAEELIREGRVTVNGRMAEIGRQGGPARATPSSWTASASSRSRRAPLPAPQQAQGLMSTISDPEGRPTVIDLVPPAMRKALVPVGRLDFHTEGLLLLTDDGEFAQRMAHPRYGSIKTYEVKVKGTAQRATSSTSLRRRSSWTRPPNRPGEDHLPRSLQACRSAPPGRARERELLVDRRAGRRAHAPDPRDVLPYRQPRAEAAARSRSVRSATPACRWAPCGT